MSRNEKEKNEIAFWVLTPNASGLAARIAEMTGSGVLFAGGSIENPPPGTVRFHSLSKAVATEFSRFTAHVFVMAAGIAVRVIAPLLKSKLSDPAVVVVDDAGRFAISLVSGHLGGANALACRIAGLIGATPVITTATDVNGVPAIDMLASEKGLFIENPETIKNVGILLLKGEKIGIHDPFRVLRDDLGPWIDDSRRPDVYIDHAVAKLPEGALVLRPKTLSVGIGCNRGTPAQEILELVKDVFDRFDLSTNSIDNIATIEAKADEQGLLEAAGILKARLRFFGRKELSTAGPVPSPSSMVKKHMGVASVCEAAAILASGKGKILAPKQKTKNVTAAVATAFCT